LLAALVPAPAQPTLMPSSPPPHLTSPPAHSLPPLTALYRPPHHAHIYSAPARLAEKAHNYNCRFHSPPQPCSRHVPAAGWRDAVPWRCTPLLRLQTVTLNVATPGKCIERSRAGRQRALGRAPCKRSSGSCIAVVVEAATSRAPLWQWGLGEAPPSRIAYCLQELLNIAIIESTPAPLGTTEPQRKCQWSGLLVDNSPEYSDAYLAACPQWQQGARVAPSRRACPCWPPTPRERSGAPLRLASAVRSHCQAY